MPDPNPDTPKKKPSKLVADQKFEKQKGKFSTEADLWNFEGEADEMELGSLQPTTRQEPTLRLIDQPDETTDEKKESATPVKLELIEEATPAVDTSADSRHMEPMPGPSSKKQKALTQTEDDIWDSFSEDQAPTAAVNQIQRPEMDINSRLAVIPSHHLHPDQFVSDIIRPPVEVVVPAAPEEANAQEHSGPASEIEAEKQTPTPGIQIAKFTPVELIASLLLLALLAIGAVVSLGLFRSHLTGQADPYATPDFPIKGALATVVKAETFWRMPVVDGPNPDATKLDVILLPVITLTLGDCKAPQGALRIMFLNHNNEIVGDTITRAYSNSIFTSSQSATMSFASTAGFTEFGEQEAYRAKIGKPWTIRVYEGPSESASSESFKLLFTTPIVATRR